MLVKEAKNFAKKHHAHQTRKGSSEPYFEHPKRVAKQLEDAGFSEEVIAAGYLHDVVEDTPVTIEEIEDYFGKRVAAIVQAHTEDKSKTWKERKQHTIDTVKAAPLEVKALIAADKLDNLRSLQKLYKKEKEQTWKLFKRGYEDQKWYNKGVADNLLYGLDENDVPAYFYELINEIHLFFQS